jgi:hypothetical protein
MGRGEWCSHPAVPAQLRQDWQGFPAAAQG